MKPHTTFEVYIHSWYAIANIVSATGSGDIFGTTDLERLFFSFLMTGGDIVFALSIGLLSEMTSSRRADNPYQNFIRNLVLCERIMTESEFNQNWKDRV